MGFLRRWWLNEIMGWDPNNGSCYLLCSSHHCNAFGSGALFARIARTVFTSKRHSSMVQTTKTMSSCHLFSLFDARLLSNVNHLMHYCSTEKSWLGFAMSYELWVPPNSENVARNKSCSFIVIRSLSVHGHPLLSQDYCPKRRHPRHRQRFCRFACDIIN